VVVTEDGNQVIVPMDSKYKVRKDLNETPSIIKPEESEPQIKLQEQFEQSKLKEIAATHPQKHVGHQNTQDHPGLWNRNKGEKIELTRPKAESNTALPQKLAEHPREELKEAKTVSYHGQAHDYHCKNEHKGTYYQKENSQRLSTNHEYFKNVEPQSKSSSHFNDDKQESTNYSRHKNSEHDKEINEFNSTYREKKHGQGYSGNFDRKVPSTYYKHEKYEYKVREEYVRKQETGEKPDQDSEKFERKDNQRGANEKKEYIHTDKNHADSHESDRNFREDRFPAKRYSRGENQLNREGDYRKSNQVKGGKPYKVVIEYQQVPSKNEDSEKHHHETMKKPSARQLDPSILMSSNPKQGKEKSKNFFSSNVFSILPKNEERE